MFGHTVLLSSSRRRISDLNVRFKQTDFPNRQRIPFPPPGTDLPDALF